VEFGLVILAALMFAYAVASKRLSATFVTGPLLFVTAGWATGPEGLDIIPVATDHELIKILLETTLVLVLFTDAMGINTSRWREEAGIPVRLLGIGLPLTLLAGWTLAFVMFGDLNVWEAGLIAIILAPTDAALGQAVVSNPRVPERIRQGLNIESGLNDGIALPIFFVFLEAAQSVESSVSIGVVANEIIRQVVVATAVGALLGWIGATIIRRASHRDWVTPGWRQLSLLILALGAWALGDALGGSGFISAWVGGLVVGILLKRSFEGIQDVAEDAGHFLTILSFFVFGSVILAPVVASMTWKVAAYALLSLTAVRIIPVVVAMLRTGLKPPSLLYLGWFGPRGLASIILVITVLDETEIAGAGIITAIMAATVGLSVYAHGFTALWGSNRYADWYASRQEHHAVMPEAVAVPNFSVSGRLGPRPGRDRSTTEQGA